MKKIAFLFLSVLCVNILVAQPGSGLTPPTITSGKWWNGGDGSSLTSGQAHGLGITSRSTPENPQSRAPLAPATLLLLGLGGAAVGAKVYRNTRKK